MYKIYTDGACSNNKKGEGIGGFGAVITNCDNIVKTIGGYKEGTTNNRMELWAVSAGLKTVLELMGANHSHSEINEHAECAVYSDSEYVVSNCVNYMPGWKANGWKKSNHKEVLNVDLWKKLDYYISKFKNVSFIWVRGHDGNELNEKADKIAVKFVERLKRRLK